MLSCGNMTRNLLLELHDGVFCEKGQREQNGTLVDYWKKVVCYDFAKLMLTPASPMEHIEVFVTDQQPPSAEKDWAEVKVMRQGYYRWWWDFKSAYHTFYNTSYGVYRAVEEILISMYPLEFDEKDEKGKHKAVTFLHERGSDVEEHTLWIRVLNVCVRP